jgi:hypothetical protein
MKIKELIELLEKEDSEKRVIISGYEGGYNDIQEIAPIKIILNYNDNKRWWYGDHEELSDLYHNRKGKEVVDAILIS